MRKLELAFRRDLHVAGVDHVAGDVLATVEIPDGISPKAFERLLQIRCLAVEGVGVVADRKPNGLKCVKCGAPLTGRQSKYCSQKCAPYK